MKIFLSWSGEKSQKVAVALRDWLPSVIQSIEPYVSSEDIDKGARWASDIAGELQASTFGILCVTKDNWEAPWLTFEAGALSRSVEKSSVVPFLLDVNGSELKDSPLLQFQAAKFDKADILKMVKSVNRACGESAILEERLDAAFNKWYPDLELSLNAIKQEKQGKGSKQPDKDDQTKPNQVLEEILELTRVNQKLLRGFDLPSFEQMTLMRSMDQFDGPMKQGPRRKRSRMLAERVIDMVMDLPGKSEGAGLPVLLSFVKEPMPWLYESGMELWRASKDKKMHKNMGMELEQFMMLLEFSFRHPAMREMISDEFGELRRIEKALYDTAQRMMLF